MKKYAGLVSLLLLFAPSIQAENQSQSESSEVVLRFKTEKEALEFILGERKKHEKRETLLQEIVKSKIGISVAEMGVEFARAFVCDSLANYIAQRTSKDLMTQLRNQEIARVGLEAGSYAIFYAFLNGSRDENDDFKLCFNKEHAADSVSSAVKYVFLNRFVNPQIESNNYTKNLGSMYKLCMRGGASLAYYQIYGIGKSMFKNPCIR